jgi:glycine/D-amino acid oxidase-like deaminating enzyme
VRATADAVVVGSGIIGASIAFQLARHQMGKVIVLDKGAGPAEGSTGASSSICRCRYTHDEVVRLAHYGLEAYGNWSEFTGLPEPRVGLQRIGVLWMLGQSREEVEADASRLRHQGVAALAIDPEELVARFPAMSSCGEPVDMESDHTCRPGEAFLLEERGGYVEPTGANQDLIEAARAQGVDVRFRSRVTGVRRTNGRVVGVDLGDGTAIDAGVVINAAGPWCNVLNAMAGVELRWTLTPTRIQTVYRDWPLDLGPLPATADSSTGIYFRPDGPRLLVGSVLPEDEEEIVSDPDDFKRSPDADFRDLKLAALHHRLPGLAARGTPSGICGLYTINREDVHPVLGPTGLEGFWVANGFSGHGFKLAPGVGSMMAQSLTGTSLPSDTDVPLGFFAVDREPIFVAVKHVLA